MKPRRKSAAHTGTHFEFRRIALLSVFCAIGILFGCLAVHSVSSQAVQQLTVYFDAYLKLKHGKPTISAFVISAAVYFRGIVLLLLFSFSTIGMYAVPLICGIQGFGLAFAIALFVQCTNVSFFAVCTLFLLRCVLLLPTMLYGGSMAMVSSIHGKDGHGKDFWRCFGICAFVLCFGALSEVIVVPKIFAAVLAA